MTGRVKWFDQKKGFGFIELDDGSPDAFVHHSDIRMKGRRNLEAGQAVELQVRQTDKGAKAVNVSPISGSAGDPSRIAGPVGPPASRNH
jgi:CspA family cold shock protein